VHFNAEQLEKINNKFVVEHAVFVGGQNNGGTGQEAIRPLLLLACRILIVIEAKGPN